MYLTLLSGIYGLANNHNIQIMMLISHVQIREQLGHLLDHLKQGGGGRSPTCLVALTKVMIVIFDQVFVRHLVMIVIDMLLTCSCEEAMLKDIIIIISTQTIT